MRELRGDLAFDIVEQTRQFTQKSNAVIRQRIIDFVFNGQLGIAQHARLPQRGDFGMQHLVIARAFSRNHRHIALCQQMRNFALGIQNTFTLYFSRMRSQHW